MISLYPSEPTPGKGAAPQNNSGSIRLYSDAPAAPTPTPQTSAIPAPAPAPSVLPAATVAPVAASIAPSPTQPAALIAKPSPLASFGAKPGVDLGAPSTLPKAASTGSTDNLTNVLEGGIENLAPFKVLAKTTGGEGILSAIKDVYGDPMGQNLDANDINAIVNKRAQLIKNGFDPSKASKQAVSAIKMQKTIQSIPQHFGFADELGATSLNLVPGGVSTEVTTPALKSAWEDLGKPKTETESAINYKTLAHVAHPDLGGSTEQMTKLNASYQLLKEHGLPGDLVYGEKTAPAPTPEPVPQPVEPVAPPVAAPEPPVASQPVAEAPKSVLPVQNTPTVDLTPPAPVTAPVDSVIPPKPSMQSTIIDKLSKPKPGVPVADIKAPVSSAAETRVSKPAYVSKPATTVPQSELPRTTNSYGKIIQPKAEPIEAASTQSVAENNPAPTKPVEDKPFTPELKESGIGKSIEQKAIDAGTTTGFEKTAQFETINHADQAKQAKSMREGNMDNFRSIIRGENPLPHGVKGQAIINEMESHLKDHPDADMAYELSNSPLVTAGSEAAQEMGLMAEREPDSAMAKIQEIKNAMVKKAGGSEKIAKAKAQIVKQLKVETEKVNLSKEDLSWNKFLSTIEC